MMREIRTNVMRMLEEIKVDFSTSSYEVDEYNLDAVHVANSLGVSSKLVYKTLVTVSGDEHFVFVVPAGGELDLKKAAKAAGVKRIEMLPLKDLTNVTGYVRGGCSPIGMKKKFPTFIHEDAKSIDNIYISAGKRGIQIIINPKDLSKIIKAEFFDLVKEVN